MAKYRKKPVVIEAVQWFGHGDHAHVKPWDTDGPTIPTCEKCGRHMDAHGCVDTLEGVGIVCPRDWIIEGIQGELYPCKPDIFEATYELVVDLDYVE